MRFLSLEERAALGEVIRRLVASNDLRLRGNVECDASSEATVWHALAEIGAVGLIIDPEYGGAGVGPLELELVMEEVGAALLCSPLLSSGVLAAIAELEAAHG